MLILLLIVLPFTASILSFFVKKQMAKLSYVVSRAAVVELIIALVITTLVVKDGTYQFIPYFSVDALGALIMMIVTVVGLAASWYSSGYLAVEMSKGIIDFHKIKQYFVLLHLFILAMLFAVCTTNPILMWIAVEATTLSTAFLISFYNKPTAIEAAWKYLIINSVGLLLGFFGTLLFLYPALQAGQGGLITWQSIWANITGFDPFVVKMAFIFILVGYGTKMGLVPMHTWLPDAHSKAPVPISSLLSGILLNIAFFAILRFKVVVDLVVGPLFAQQLLIFFGIISILVPAFIILSQKNYKRLLAYSSIEHMGIMALGFGFGGNGVFAALLHMVYHSLAKSLLFLSSGNIFLKYSSTKIANVKGALSVLPITGVAFIIGFLAITGVPPFGIFLTEFTILSAGIQQHPAVTVLALFGLVLVFVGFFKHMVAMMFGDNEKQVTHGEAGKWTVLPIIMLIIILVTVSLFIPAPLTLLINSATSVY